MGFHHVLFRLSLYLFRGRSSHFYVTFTRLLTGLSVLHRTEALVFTRSFRTLMVISVVAGSLTASAQTPQNPPPAPPKFDIGVDVIETTPLPGLDLPLEQIPAPVQTAVSADIEASGALDLCRFLNRRLNGVFVNEMQGNPFQPDLNYRGYTASPLLGTPQGLSVYMDGVRLNQPFGDVVSWDLIPRMAIASTTLMPGSNPLFGLNTLGGALSIQTKDGRSNPGTSVRAIYGSDVRRAVEFEHGGSRASGLHWYVAGNLFAEDGWRDDSPSTVGQIFGKLGWHRRPERYRAVARLREQFADRQRSAGAAVSRARLRERLHRAGRDRQPLDVSQSDDAARPDAAR